MIIPGYVGVMPKIEKFAYQSDPKCVVRNINPRCTDPIEIELAIVEMLLKLIYVIGENKKVINTYTRCNGLIEPWTLNIQNTIQYVYKMVDDLHYLDNLRVALKTVTEPALAEQMRALRKSAFLCYSIDFKSNIIEKACYSAIDMILDAANANFNIEFSKLDSFNIKVVQKKNYKAKLRMEVELIPEENPKNGDVSDASFTVNYTDDLNNPLEIQDPSAAIASLLMLFYNWYFSNIEKYDGCNKEEMEFNFKDSIMTILPTCI